MEINPIEKKQEILESLKEQNVKVKTCKDKGYDFLDENSVCIVVGNSNPDRELELELENEGSFTLYFAGGHCHYCGEEEEFRELRKDTRSILANSVCSAAIYYGADEKCLGVGFFDKAVVESPYKKTFNFVLKHKEFLEKIKKQGGIVRYMFWDSRYDSSIKIETSFKER